MNKVHLIVCLASCWHTCPAASFRNLDFQSPIINANFFPPRELVRNIIPGWQLEIGGQVQQSMFYNNVCLSCPSAKLLGPENPKLGDKFVFSMFTGDVLNPTYPVSIYQTGDVPLGTRSLLFFGVAVRSFLAEWHISLGGQELPIQEIEKSPAEYKQGGLYGVDVASWAGKTAELRFTVGPGSFLNSAGGIFEGIHFSSAAIPAIPEPSTWALLGTGVAAFAWHHRRGRRRG